MKLLARVLTAESLAALNGVVSLHIARIPTDIANTFSPSELRARMLKAVKDQFLHIPQEGMPILSTGIAPEQIAWRETLLESVNTDNPLFEPIIAIGNQMGYISSFDEILTWTEVSESNQVLSRPYEFLYKELSSMVPYADVNTDIIDTTYDHTEMYDESVLIDAGHEDDIHNVDI